MKVGEDMKMIAFDFDGTLMDSMGMWRNLTKNFLKSKGVEFSEEIAQTLTTVSLAEYCTNVLKIPLTEEDVFHQLGEIILQQYMYELQLKPGAISVLEGLKDMGIPLCLATATRDEFVLPTLDHLNLRKYFSFVQTGQNSGYRKNNPMFYKVLAKRSSVEPKDLLLVDDAVYALDAAKDAGLQTLAIYDKHSDESWALGEYKKHKAIEHLSQVVEQVGGIG
ncbi:MAG: HAD family phosphatase [Tissierellia bacterium]|nr:HAD family phosphatase [Tissierellia bacterium]